MLAAAAESTPPPNYYEGLAEELEQVAKAIRDKPDLNHHFAERLIQLAKELREDVRLMRLSTRQS